MRSFELYAPVNSKRSNMAKTRCPLKTVIMIIHIHLNAMKEQDCVSSKSFSSCKILSNMSNATKYCQTCQMQQNIVKHVKCSKILSNISNAAKYCQTCQMQQNIVKLVKCSKILSDISNAAKYCRTYQMQHIKCSKIL